MLIIGAGPGRTGTSSLHAALTALGFKTYHMKKGVVETPGHLDLWDRHLGGGGGHTANTDAILDGLAASGFNATTDFPACVLYAELLARYPDARVILSLRSSPDKWAASVGATIGDIPHQITRVPWRWLPFMQKFLRLNVYIWDAFGVGDGTGAQQWTSRRTLPDRATWVAAYNAWADRVRRDVPAAQLLEFRPSDGWAPLCAFLRGVDAHGNVDRRCEGILQRQEPYPWVNDGKVLRTTTMALSGVALVFEWWPVVVLLLLLVLLRRRRRTRRTRKKD